MSKIRDSINKALHTLSHRLPCPSVIRGPLQTEVVRNCVKSRAISGLDNCPRKLCSDMWPDKHTNRNEGLYNIIIKCQYAAVFLSQLAKLRFP